MKNGIKNKRECLGLTQMELAQRIGVTQGAVTQWETGATKPSTDTLMKIAEVFGCTVDELLRPA